MNSRLIVLGYGGHASACAEVAEEMNIWERIEFLDDKQQGGSSVLGSLSEWEKCIAPDTEFFCAIGDNQTRKHWLDILMSRKMPVACLISKTAKLGKRVVPAKGSVIMPGAIIRDTAIIEAGAIINTGAIVEHHCEVGMCSHLGPGSILAGGVSIGDLSFAGAGSRVIQHVHIAEGAVLGAGAVLLEDIQSAEMWAGIPAKKIRDQVK